MTGSLLCAKGFTVLGARGSTLLGGFCASGSTVQVMEGWIQEFKDKSLPFNLQIDLRHHEHT